MHSFWSSRTSVTRDFAMLSVVIIFITILASVWIVYDGFKHEEQLTDAELRQEAQRIDRAFSIELERASYLLEAIGRQIIQRGTTDKTVIAQMLRAYDTNNEFYSVFLWVDNAQMAVTSSRQGVLETPVDISDRGYIKKSLAEPFKVQVGKPTQGRVSETLVIPMGMGLTDYTGKYIGTVTLSLDLQALTRVVDDYLRNDELSFAILSEGLSPLTQVNKDTEALASDVVIDRLTALQGDLTKSGTMVHRPELMDIPHHYVYAMHASGQPYYILVGDTRDLSAFGKMLFPRLLQLLLVAAFLMLLLWLVRWRVIFPVQNLVIASAEIARGNSQITVPKGGPLEITRLADQLRKIVDFIAERKRIEEELVAKVLALKTAKDIAEISDQAKMELLNSLRHEAFPSLEKVLNASNILTEQPYGKIEEEGYTSQIETLDAGSTHLAELIHEIFEFPRQERHETFMNRKPVDINAVVHKCLTLLEVTIQSEEVDVQVDIPQDLPKLNINELHITHVVMHMLSACLNLIPAGGELSISAALEDGPEEDSTEFAIFFKDNGTGLDAQQIAKSWRATDQVRRMLRRSGVDDDHMGGAASVALTKKIVTIYNGRLTMQNPPGKEAIIAVYFPQ